MRASLTLLLCLVLAGCGGNLDDIQQFVKDSGQGLRGKVEPLPEVKPYEPFAYNAFDLADPFRPRKLDPGKGVEGGLQPDTTRRKEPLEMFPLENLKMVGFLQKEGLLYALVITPERDLHQVKVGNYLGQNYGIITDIIIHGINEAEIRLTELAQDSAGVWTERQSTLALAGDEAEQKPSAPPQPEAPK
jgi:type IV pilus assembly protein PilP